MLLNESSGIPEMIYEEDNRESSNNTPNPRIHSLKFHYSRMIT